MIKFPPTRQDYYPLGGGLDLVTPAIAVNPGKLIDSQNYEPAIAGGYRRIDGYERYDGQASPTGKSYYLVYVTLSATVSVGNTITGATSGATGIVLANYTTYLVCANVTGTFAVAENITVSAAVKGVISSLTLTDGAALPSDNADYKLLAANYQRTLINAIPGSGKIRGVWMFNDVWYAFRDNAGGTAGIMYKSTSSGWAAVSFGYELPIGTLTTNSTVTITVAAPGVVSYASHPFVNGQPIQLTTTGALPTGLSVSTTYYVVSQAAGTFQLALTVGGASITTTGTQSGVHTCTAIGNTITVGQTITGKTSGATSVVSAALLRTGTWTASPVGALVLTTITGTFQSGEALTVGGLLVSQSTAVASAITRAAGGTMEFFNYNFVGTTNSTKMYGCDGVNPAFEFDGTTYVPIRTGMTTDTPSHIIGYKSSLFLSFAASVQFSGIGNPYAWTVVLGAGEFNVSKNVTGFLPQGGTSAGSSLAIFTAERTFILYGSSSVDFKLVSSIFDVGYSAFTCQQVSNSAYGLTNRGIQSLVSTLQYGDFDYESISHMIQPLITKKRGLECASNTIRTKNQYRVYFTDGSALAVGITGDMPSGITVIDYGIPVRCICSTTMSDGSEVTMFGSDDGYVYQDNIGTSQDGNAIEAWIRLPFNNNKSPLIRKRFRKAIFEISIDGYSSVNISYDLGYASPDILPSAPAADTPFSGNGGYWEQFTWDSFTWDSAFISQPFIRIDGTEKNISLLFYSDRAQDLAHTVSGVTLLSTMRILER